MPRARGWTCAQVDAPTRAQILKLVELNSEPGVDVRIARHGDIDVVGGIDNGNVSATAHKRRRDRARWGSCLGRA